MYINKKIDSLGRIVIPKEIRNKLHILENENLDISLDDNKITIQKASDDLFNRHVFESIIYSMKKEYSIDINIFNISGIYYNDNGIKLLSKEFESFISDNQSLINNNRIFPIYANGIIYGGIIVNKNISYEIEKNLLCYKSFLEKYLEQ